MSDDVGFTGNKFSACSWVLNPVSGKYNRATETEREICCLEICKPISQKCMEVCIDKNLLGRDRIQCQNSCINIQQSCQDGCDLLDKRWEEIYDSIREIGCSWKDSDCIKANKQKILRNCKENCIPSDRVSCGEYCNYSLDKILNPDDLYFMDYSRGPDHPEKSFATALSRSNKSTKNRWYLNLILSFSSLLIIIFGIILLFIHFLK